MRVHGARIIAVSLCEVVARCFGSDEVINAQGEDKNRGGDKCEN